MTAKEMVTPATTTVAVPSNSSGFGSVVGSVEPGHRAVSLPSDMMAGECLTGQRRFRRSNSPSESADVASVVERAAVNRKGLSSRSREIVTNVDVRRRTSPKALVQPWIPVAVAPRWRSEQAFLHQGGPLSIVLSCHDQGGIAAAGKGRMTGIPVFGGQGDSARRRLQCHLAWPPHERNRGKSSTGGRDREGRRDALRRPGHGFVALGSTRFVAIPGSQRRLTHGSRGAQGSRRN